MLGEKEAQLKIIFLNLFLVVSIKATISTENQRGWKEKEMLLDTLEKGGNIIRLLDTII